MSTRRSQYDERERSMIETQMTLAKECATPGCDGMVPFDHLDEAVCSTCRDEHLTN